MQSVSSKWAPALASDHGLSVRVNVQYDGDTTAEDIGFVDGSVKVDRGSDVRRSLSLSIADPSDFPLTESDTYGVYGQRLYVEAGLTYIDGTSERVPMGFFVITNVGGNIHTGPIEIAAAGLEIILKRTEMEAATSTAAWGSVAIGMEAALAAVVPDSGFVNLSSKGTTVPATRTWDAGTDWWTALREVADSIGAELFCNANGSFVLADIPDVNGAGISTVWNVAAGEGGVMVSAEVDLTSEDVYNRIIAMGENTSDNVAPIRQIATITDPTDPLRYGGPFGKKTKSYSSALLSTPTKALEAAEALLRKYRAPNRSVTLQTVPNPALDAGDRIRADYGPGIDPELHLVQSFEIPLVATAGASTIATISGRTDAE